MITGGFTVFEAFGAQVGARRADKFKVISVRHQFARFAMFFAIVVAGVPLLRPQDAASHKFTKAYSAKSRPAEASETADVAVSGGVAVGHGEKNGRSIEQSEEWRRFDANASKQVRSAWAEIGVVAQYDKWLNPRESKASFEVVPKVDGTKTTKTTSSSSREVDAGGRETAKDPKSSGTEEKSPVVLAGQELRTNEKAFVQLQAGLDAFKGRDYGKAYEALRRAAPLAPDNGIPRFHVALAAFALGEYDAAAWNLRRGLDLLPEFVRLGSDIRPLYGDATDLEDQFRALESYVRLHPESVEARVLLGYVRFATGNSSDAKTLFAALAKERPDDPLPSYMIAVIGGA